MTTRHRGVSTETQHGPRRRWAVAPLGAAQARGRSRGEGGARSATARDDSRDTSGAASRIRESAGDAPDPDTVEEPVLTDEDMPPLESLDENSDYSGFLSSGVSEGLRRRALRKLFSSAVFNVPDGLDDYDDDFTSFAALGDIVTSDMKHQAEMEAERAKRTQVRAEPATGTEEGPGGSRGRAARIRGRRLDGPRANGSRRRSGAVRAGRSHRARSAGCRHGRGRSRIRERGTLRAAGECRSQFSRIRCRRRFTGRCAGAP